MSKLLTVLLDTRPLGSGHVIRGVGSYTRNLLTELEQTPDLLVYRSSILEKNEHPHIDITHYPFFDLFFNSLPFISKGKTIVTVHDVIPLLYPEEYKPGMKGSLAFYRQRVALSRADALITDSECSKKDISTYLKIKPDKIHVVPLAATDALAPQPKDIVIEVKKFHSLPENYVLYVGDINYNKNIPQLIKMMKFLPEPVHLVCVGKHFFPQPIPEWQWIEKQMALSNVEQRVHFLTDILVDSTKELSALYTGALCYVQPSLYEGFGLPILEAMRCKTVVISSNGGSLPEVAGTAALLTEPNAEAFALAVESVLMWSKTKRLEFIRHASAWEKTFSWEKAASKTVDVYKSVVHK